MIQTERDLNGVLQEESRFYISSAAPNALYLNNAARSHWGVENKLHWILDVTFKEDYSRIRKLNGAENFSIVRRIALNLLKKETSVKIGINSKRMKAGWDNNYLQKVMKI